MKKKIAAFILMFSGFGLIGYSIFLENVLMMTIGFILIGICMFIALFIDADEFKDHLLDQKKIFNDIIDLIKDDKLKEAYNKCKNELNGEKDKSYVNGLIFGRKYAGDEIIELKFDLSDDKN